MFASVSGIADERTTNFLPLPANVLFDKIVINKKEGVEVPRSFDDYEITVDINMPEGVELQEKV